MVEVFFVDFCANIAERERTLLRTLRMCKLFFWNATNGWFGGKDRSRLKRRCRASVHGGLVHPVLVFR
jgi:hypothetical protein